VKFDPTGSGFDSRGMKLSNPGIWCITVLMLLNTASWTLLILK
jgi:hypothetical protein